MYSRDIVPVHVVLSYKLQYIISNKSNPDKLTIRTGNGKRMRLFIGFSFTFSTFWSALV